MGYHITLNINQAFHGNFLIKILFYKFGGKIYKVDIPYFEIFFVQNFGVYLTLYKHNYLRLKALKNKR